MMGLGPPNMVKIQRLTLRTKTLLSGASSSVHLTHYCAGDKIENEMGGACSADGGGEVCTGFWWGNLRERVHWRDPGVDGRIILRWIFRKWDVGVWTGLSWFRIEAGGGHL
jgi:hypothetical protein